MNVFECAAQIATVGRGPAETAAFTRAATITTSAAKSTITSAGTAWVCGTSNATRTGADEVYILLLVG